MSERSRLKASKGENTPGNPKNPFDITKYVNPISVGSAITLVSLGLYFKYKWDAWEYENLMKAKQCKSIEEAIQTPGQYVNFVGDANSDNLFVAQKIIDEKPLRAVLLRKEVFRKIRTKGEFATEDVTIDDTTLRGPIFLTDSKRRYKIEANEFDVDNEKGIKLDEIIFQERVLPKKIRNNYKDSIDHKMYDREKILYPGTPLTAFGVIKKVDGKFELVKDKSKPYYLTTKPTEEIIADANEKVSPTLFWSAVGTGGVGVCALTVGIIKLYMSK